MRILIYNKYIFTLGGNHFMAKIIALFNNKGGVSKTTKDNITDITKKVNQKSSLF